MKHKPIIFLVVIIKLQMKHKLFNNQILTSCQPGLPQNDVGSDRGNYYSSEEGIVIPVSTGCHPIILLAVVILSLTAADCNME